MTKEVKIRFDQQENLLRQHEKSIIDLNEKVSKVTAIRSDATLLGSAAGADNISLSDLETTVKVLRKIKGQGFKQIQL